MVGYDLDGVLAKAPPPRPKPWSQMTGNERRLYDRRLLSHYKRAKPLYRPKRKDWVVVTARKALPDIQTTTLSWFRSNGFGRPIVFFLQGARSINNVVEFKADIIDRLELTDFYEDNLSVVRGLRSKVGDRCQIWLYEDGQFWR